MLASTTDKPASQMPPTEDAFEQHACRARYQAAIWCNSHVGYPLLWDPVGSGWKLRECELEPDLYHKDAAPLEVRDLTHLYCNDNLCTDSRKCPCIVAGLPCIDLCDCNDLDCANTLQQINVDDSDLEN